METMVETLGESCKRVCKVTATKTGDSLWTLFIPDGSGKNSQRTVTTQDLVDGDSYTVLADSLSQSATEGQKRQQKEALKRRRNAAQRRREQMATEVAKQRRKGMLRNEFERIVGLVSGRIFTYEEFLATEKKLTNPYECEVVIEGHTMLAFANHHTEGAFSLTMQKQLLSTLFNGKRLNELAPEGSTNTAKRQNTGRYVPTKNSEDGISAVEILEVKDLKANLASRVKEKKALEREISIHDKYSSALQRYREKKKHDFFLVQDSTVNTHITLIYRLYSGDRKKQAPAYMHAYLKPLKIDRETASEKIDALGEKLKGMKEALVVLTELIDSEKGDPNDTTTESDLV